MSNAFALAVIGFLVGFVSTLTGLGAGLSLPLLACAGVPLPAALLAIKLPVAAGDLAAVVAGVRWRQTPVEPIHWPGLRRGWSSVLICGLAGALGAAWVGSVPPGIAAAAVAAVLLLALALPRTSGPGATRAVTWSAYLGACGAGAGLLMAWQARREGCRFSDANLHARRLGAAANSGAVLLLFAVGQATGPTIWLLALAQAMGAMLAAAAQPRTPTVVAD